MYVALSLLVSFVLVLSGCGGSDDATTPGPITVDGADYAFVMPDEIVGGVVAMRFRNVGKEPHEFAFGRIDGDHTIDEAIEDLFASDGDVPYLTDLGGPPLLSSGEEITITRKLEPGTYGLLCFVPNADGELHLRLGMKRQFQVVGDTDATLPSPDAVITATAKGFEVPEIEAGTRTIELRNESGEDREWVITTYLPGKTATDVEAWAESGLKGDPPAAFHGAMQSIPSGMSVFVTLEFAADTVYTLEDLDAGLRAEIRPA